MVKSVAVTLQDTHATYQNMQATNAATIAQGRQAMMDEMSTLAK